MGVIRRSGCSDGGGGGRDMVRSGHHTLTLTGLVTAAQAALLTS